MPKLLIKKVSQQAMLEADEAFNILEQISRKLDPNHPAERMSIDVAKAKIEQALGNKAAALESSKTSLALAKEAKNDDYVKINALYRT